MNTEEFVRLSREKHGDKYDYSHVVYVKAKDKVKIICPIHGEFEQCAFSHYKCGSGCSKCSAIERGSNSKKWTYEKCYEEAKKYKTRSEYKKGCGGSYKIANQKRWLNDYTWLECSRKPNGYWTYESCYAEAKKYKSRKEYEEYSCSAYNVSLKNGWLDNYIWFEEKMKPKGYWTYERCYEEAKKYKTRKSFQIGCGSAYSNSLKNGWLRDYTWFVNFRKPRGYYSKYENCLDETKKYKSRNEFKKGCASAYNASRKNGWLDTFFPK